MANSLKARVSNLHDVESNWNLCKDFIPMSGEIIVYDADDTVPYQRFKIGDGVTTVIELPFVVDNTVEVILSYSNGIGYIDGGRITDYE